jgi:hypothetical protein
MPQQSLHFGPEITPSDEIRLCTQQEAIRRVMGTGEWFTFKQLQRSLGGMGIVASEAGISARIRALRTPEQGSHKIEKRRKTPGIWEYRLTT